MIKLVIQRN